MNETVVTTACYAAIEVDSSNPEYELTGLFLVRFPTPGAVTPTGSSPTIAPPSPTIRCCADQVSFAFAAGLFVIVAMVPLNAALAKRIGAVSRELMKHKDDRVQRCSEMLHGIRVGS